MNALAEAPQPGGAAALSDTGLVALCVVAGHYRVAADPFRLRHDLALGERLATTDDLVLAARRIGLRARAVQPLPLRRLTQLPLPAILRSREDGRYAILAAGREPGRFRLVDPIVGELTQTVSEALHER